MSQLSLLPVACKQPGCTRVVVGSSITGTGYVCKTHNEREWSDALARSDDPYHQHLARRLLDATRAARQRKDGRPR